MNGFGFTKINMLVEQAKLKAVHFDYFAFVRTFLCGYDAKYRRLSCAVTADKSNFSDGLTWNETPLRISVPP